jgi:hypothetical protein
VQISRRKAILVAFLSMAAGGVPLLRSVPAGAAGGAPAIKHVFVVNLENKGFASTFGADSKAPYLAKTLRSKGAMLNQYFGIGHNSLTNYIAQISGQAPTPATQADCGTYVDVVPGTAAADGQVTGNGCVYPAGVSTLANQLSDSGLTWKGYMEDMGNNGAREAATCAHPALGSVDNTQAATVGDQYATRHNPFVYFHSIIDSPACNTNVVPMTRLANDLQSVATTPNLTYITPNLCNDGHDDPCVDGRKGGLVAIDAFLRNLVPQILASPAYQRDGLLVLTFDESDGGDSSACCSEQPGPNVVQAGGSGPGGGRVGAVLLSPFIRPGTVSETGYNHYSLLRSIEDIFGLSHLGYAARAELASFGADVYTNPSGSPVPGYWFTASDGGIFSFGTAKFFGSTGGTKLNQPIVSMAATPSGQGYWLTASDGGIFSFGDAKFFGSTGGTVLNRPITAMTAAPDGGGYWLTASDGGIFSFGSAKFFGSTGAMKLNKPIVAMAATPSGQGYWLTASDGGIFSFGDAKFFGSTGAITLNRPIVGMAATPTGKGYWLVASDGGIFAFGDAKFFGSTGATKLNKPIVGMASTITGAGYWLVASDGGIFSYGDAGFAGSTGAMTLNQPIVGMTAM